MADVATPSPGREASVVMCTHNPRPEILARTLAALRAQTAPLGRWELVIVDNASTPPVAGQVDLSWHPAARVVREEPSASSTKSGLACDVKIRHPPFPKTSGSSQHWTSQAPSGTSNGHTHLK